MRQARSSPIYMETERTVNLMVYFVGEYARQMDDRNRFILPAKIREKLSGTVYITKAPVEKCLNLYTEEEWEVIAQKVRELPTGTDKNAAAFQRKLFGKAIDCDLDKQGRITLTPALAEYAGIDKDIMLVGANTKLEIWDAAAWEQTNEFVDEDIVIEGIKQYNINI